MTTVFVKGLGLIGSTLIRAIRQKHPQYRIVGSDISTATLDFAIEQGLIDDAGTSSIRGAEELRVKETDRIQTVVAELRKLGVQVEELTDGMIIKGRSQWAINNDRLDSYGDHRIGMMDAIAALKADRPLQLANADAVSVSYPGFFQDLERLLGGDLA